jgi:hypothetical protein
VYRPLGKTEQKNQLERTRERKGKEGGPVHDLISDAVQQTQLGNKKYSMSSAFFVF